MAFKGLHLLGLLLLLGSVTTCSVAVTHNSDTFLFNRSSFPAGFIFGTASSAYQYEGAADEDGRGPSIWDTYTHKYSDRIKDGSNGDVAIDAYHRYKEDVGIMKEMNLDAYRFSISWSRVLPKGKLSGGANKKGIIYYNNLINELLAKGLQPFVTLFHWDLPQTLEDDFGGFLSPRIVHHFQDYAELCFKEFGDRVKHWITLNEPSSYSIDSYVDGTSAPGRCSDWQQLNCTGGDSGTEPYLVAHHQLLAHAAAVKLYKDKYQASQKGMIGITINSKWFVPVSCAKEHQDAAERALDFMFGWFMDPLTNGDYPHSMRLLVGKRLPEFSKEESKMLKGSFDFLGLNYYSARYAACASHLNNTPNPSYLTDARVNLSNWHFVYPRGIRDLLLYTKQKYNDPVIYITENGIDEKNNETLSLEEALADNMRIDYYYHHLSYLKSAIENGVNIKGYFAWSLLDNFEWSSGYTVRFGINYVDYKDGLKRYPKLSAIWVKKFLHKEREALTSL